MSIISRKGMLFLHELTIQVHGGSPGIRDEGLLDSAINQPLQTFGGQDLYPTLLEKVAALGFSLISNHVFVDGNKRAGLAAMLVVLDANGFAITASESELERICLAVASGTADRADLLGFLNHHLKPITDD